jgi:hypothetical protein
VKYNPNQLRGLAKDILDVEMRFDLPGLSDEFYTATADEFLRSPNAEHAETVESSIYDDTLALDLSRAYFNATKLAGKTAGHMNQVRYATINSLREMARRIDRTEDENSVNIFKAIDV